MTGMNHLPTRKLGRDGPEVTVICLGTWGLGGGLGAIEEKQAIRTVHAALDAGTNFIDTAEGYLTAESMLGKALAGRRDGVILATKLSGEHSPQHIRTAIENSLRQLRTDYIDLYQIHHPNPRWPIADTMAELAKLKEEGKVRWHGPVGHSLGRGQPRRDLGHLRSQDAGAGGRELRGRQMEFDRAGYGRDRGTD